MIPVPNPIEEPADFEEKCRKKGLSWLAKNPAAKRPYSYWRIFNSALRAGFSERCAFQGLHITSGTVDHFKSWNKNKDLAYEWSNFRYVEGWLNSSKTNKSVEDLVDPFENCEGWFEITLPSLQMIVADGVPEEHRQRAEATLKEFCLRDDERAVQTRRSYMKLYEEGKLSLEGLDDWFPLLARAIRKRGGHDV